MKEIAIDCRMACCSGIGRYIRGTLCALTQLDSQFDYQIIGDDQQLSRLPRSHFQISHAGIYGLQEQFEILRLAKRSECLHVPHYNAPLAWSKKLIVTVHDLIHLHFTHYLDSPMAKIYAKIMLPVVLEKASAIIAVSEYTKQDLVSVFGIPPQKITVIYHGIDAQFQEVKLPAGKLAYFLYVGLLKPHKNIGTLLAAFRRLQQEANFQPVKLVLVGKADTKHEVVKTWLREMAENKMIEWVSEASDEDLIRYYQGASALILPSRYEGFGFPLIEAMACGTPIIASDAASIPEIASDAALYFDPASSDELAQAMKQILTDTQIRTQLIDKGRVRRQVFSWTNAARKTLQVYESVMGQN